MFLWQWALIILSVWTAISLGTSASSRFMTGGKCWWVLALSKTTRKVTSSFLQPTVTSIPLTFQAWNPDCPSSLMCVAPTGHGTILHPCPWRLSRSALVSHPQHTARSRELWEVLPCGRKGCLRSHTGCSATCSHGRTPPALQGPKQRPLSLVAAALVGCLPILPSLNPRPRVLAALPCKDSCRRLVLLPGLPCVLCADPQPAQVGCSVTVSGRRWKGTRWHTLPLIY